MPPANSPDPEQAPSFISALRELESPVSQDVLNLAATLGTQTDDHDDEDNDAMTDAPSPSHHPNRAPLYDEQMTILIERQRQLRRVLDARERQRRLEMSHGDRLNRISDSTSAYGDRVPSQNSLYDWSPATHGEGGDNFYQILAQLRREHPHTQPDILEAAGRAQMDSERQRTRSTSNRPQNEWSSGPPGPLESSLRSTAILQSVRRHPRFSSYSNDFLSRRSQSTRDSATRNSQNSTTRARNADDADVHSEHVRRLSTQRRLLERSSSTQPAPPSMLEQTIRYLSRTRHAKTINESMAYAQDAGFLSKDHFCIQYTDFITRTTTIPPPAETSWLAPGAVLSGYQHATNSNGSALTTPAPGLGTSTHWFRVVENHRTGMLPSLLPPTRPWTANSYSSGQTQRPSEISAQLAAQDRWPVKVTIHVVDWESMSLSATMEAHNVPSQSPAHNGTMNPVSSLSSIASQHYTRTSSITTYIEGEILDFNTFTLLTESFTSNPANDATYWRKLPPFQKMTEDEIVRALISQKWFNEVLGKEWILMRWKERCFVKSLHRSPNDAVPSTTTPAIVGRPTEHGHNSSAAPQPQPSPYRIVRNQQTGRAEVDVVPSNSAVNNDSDHVAFDVPGCGLTISGFYYVSLRRSDGKLEGLYYDPQSSPHQCLRLDSVKGGVFPAWGFR